MSDGGPGGPPPGACIAILAGGAGTRMGGACKPFLLVDGRRIIDRQLEVMRPLFSRIAIVADDPAGAFAPLGWPVIPDRAGAGLGPVAGLDAALAWAGAGSSGDVVCVAADMPYLSEPLLRRLRDHPAGRGVIPRHGGRLEPLCARYPRQAGAEVAAFLAAGGRALHRLADRLAMDVIDEAELRTLSPDLADFVNLNRPEDLTSPRG